MSRERIVGPRGTLGAKGMVLFFCLLSFAVPAQEVTEKRPATQGADPPLLAASPEGPPTRPELMGAYGKLPLSFEANRGQTDAPVRFLSRAVGYTLFLTDDEAVLALRSRQSSVVSSQWRRTGDYGPRTRNRLIPSSIDNHQSSIDNSPAPAVLRLKLRGANPEATVTGLEELPGKSHYFLGNDPKKWRTSVPNYARVKYENVYPGVDLVYYGNQRQLECDFVVAPGADPKAITLEIETGNSKLEIGKSKIESGQAQIQNPKSKIDANGDLVITTDDGEVRFHKPIVYQFAPNPESRTPSSEKQFLDGRYVLRPGELENRNSKITNPQSSIVNRQWEVGFEIASYDPTRPVVIDPVLSYATFLGGSGFDYAYGVAVDSAGSAYVTGYTDSIDFPLANPARATPPDGSCGTDPDTYPCFDAFVAKLNATGTTLVYSTYFGGSGEDYASEIAVDSHGNAYVTGYTNSTDLPTVSAAQAVHGGGACGASPCFDAFAAKLDATGAAFVYSTYLGGSADDYGQGIAVDSAGNAIVTGFTASTDFPTAGALESVHGGGTHDAFVTKLGPTGSTLAYSTYLGGSGDDLGMRVAADSSGYAYVTGYTNSTDFPVASPWQTANGGGTCGTPPNTIACFDAYAAKLDVDGSSLVFSTYLGGSGGDYGYGIAADASGSAYVTGMTTSTDFPVTPEAFQLAGGGTSVDAYVVKLAPTGASAVYATYFGGLGAEAGLDIAVDSSGSAYVAGYAYGNSLPLASPLQATSGGYYDAFLAKLNAAGSALVFSTYLGGSGNEKAQGVAVDASGNAYLAGGTFSSDFPVTSGAFQTSYGFGAFDAFVAKFENLALPALRLSAAEVTFAAQGVDTTSPAQMVTLANIGDADLTLSGIVVSGDFAQTNDCAGTVVPGAGCTLSIAFTPAELGPRRGTITIASNAYRTPHVIDLAGTGVAAPRVTLSSTSLTFADQNLGTTSVPQTVTLSNTGAAVLTITSIAASGDFTATYTCGSSLPVEGDCTITVAFDPTAPGTSVGAITIADNAPGSPHVVRLTGNGLGPAVALSSNALDFGHQLVGTSSTHQTVILRNTGNRPLDIGSITGGGDFSQAHTCGASLAAGAGCTIDVTFTPTAVGARSGTLAITNNAPDGPHTIVLSGTGTDFLLTASPATAAVVAGRSASYALTVTPSGGFDQQVSLLCVGAPKGVTCSVSPGYVTADGAGPAAAAVTVATTARGFAVPRVRFQPPTSGGPFGLPIFLWLLAFAVAACGVAVPRKRAWRTAVLACLLVVSWTACGGGVGVTSAPAGGTPSGTYTLTLTGTVGTVTRSTTVTLHVD